MDIAFLENLVVATGLILIMFITDVLTKNRRKVQDDLAVRIPGK